MTFSNQLMHQRLVLLGKVARSPANSALRSSTFIDDTLTPQVGRYVRRVGRPRLDWYTQTKKDANTVFNFNFSLIDRCLRDKSPDSARRWAELLQNALK